MAAVELLEVEKLYGTTRALSPLNLHIADGEIVALVGPSGCGKTTTLHLIAGLEDPSSGQIRLGGRPVNQVPPRERDVALVFQHSVLFPHLTVFDNLAFGLRMRGWQRGRLHARVQEIAGRLELGELLQRKPGELSGGQGQRVAIGRAMMRAPAACLLDEPLSQLDLPLRGAVREALLQELRRESTTTLYVTHDQAESLRVGDRVAVLNGGRLQQVAKPRELYENPANLFVARFMGSPPMNVWSGTVQRSEGRLRIVCGEAPILVPEAWHDRWPLREGARVEVGVRPEHVGLNTSANPAATGWEFEADLVACEDLGSDTLVELSSAALAARVTVRAAGGWSAPARSSHRVLVPWERLHFFDPRDGRRLAAEL